MTATGSGASGNGRKDASVPHGETEKERDKAEVQRRLDEELAETFPASDAPSVTQPGAGQETGPEVERDDA
ncbi:MAG: hypothetical protein ACOYJQ_08075 [Pseudochelatococcus sp.]|uniref:hypothetical protein n=1 Tax=Pseudochelatococcus sp. TaxID=2020869 RepID=UPI003D94E3AE